MDVLVERPGALDVHKAKVTAAVRLPPLEGKRRRRELVAEFSTTVPGLMRLAGWLAEHGVRNVAMEATGDYWNRCGRCSRSVFDLMLVNAQHVKQVPGRKTDVKDAQWLCRLLEPGLLRPSMVPAAPMRALVSRRDIARPGSTSANARFSGCTRCSKTPDQARHGRHRHPRRFLSADA